MSGESAALRVTENAVRNYQKLIASALALEKEIEKYYLREEAHIRERVLLLDQIQSNIAEERRCLEIDHQECRSQISILRKNHLTLQCDETKYAQLIARTTTPLEREEKNLDEQLAWANERLKEEAQQLESLAGRFERLEKEEQKIERRELQQYRAEQELEKALRDLKTLESDIDNRRQTLEKKQDNISMWNHSLEAREKELVHFQEQFRKDLRRLEEDEKHLGIYRSGSAITPMVSQREVMDDHNMTIEKENDREEIDLEEEDDHIL